MTQEAARLAKRMKQIAYVTERSAQRAHDALNWSDPADTAEEIKACDEWWAKHWAATWADKATA